MILVMGGIGLFGGPFIIWTSNFDQVRTVPTEAGLRLAAYFGDAFGAVLVALGLAFVAYALRDFYRSVDEWESIESTDKGQQSRPLGGA